jgi:nitrogen-specific signal transduction histidine kinase
VRFKAAFCASWTNQKMIASTFTGTVSFRILTRLICDEADRIVKLVDRMEVFGTLAPPRR